MTSENNPQTPDISAMPEEQVREALASVLKIREIERTMLTRAVATIVEFTKKAPAEVIAILSTDLDEDYEKAADDASKPKFYVPPTKEGKLHIPLVMPRSTE